MEGAELLKKADATLLIAKIIALANAILVFIYPMIVAASAGGQILGSGYQAMDPGVVKVGFFAGLLLLLAAGKLAQIPLQACFRRNYAVHNPGALLSAWLLSVIIGFALREAAAIIGLILSILTGNLFWCVALGVLSLIAMARNWPVRSALEGVISGIASKR